MDVSGRLPANSGGARAHFAEADILRDSEPTSQSFDAVAATRIERDRSLRTAASDQVHDAFRIGEPGQRRCDGLILDAEILC
jgi:hypothetical protein